MLVSSASHKPPLGSPYWVRKGSHAVPVHVVRQKIGFSHSECTLDCGDPPRLELVMESQVIDGLHEGIKGIPLTVYLRQIAERDLRQFHHRGSVNLKRRVRITPQSLETGPRINDGDTKTGPQGRKDSVYVRSGAIGFGLVPQHHSQLE